MKRKANPHFSPHGEDALARDEQELREQEDLTPATIRNYLSTDWRKSWGMTH
jgi:hypothetical protein